MGRLCLPHPAPRPVCRPHAAHPSAGLPPLGHGRPLTAGIFFPDEAANEEDRLWLALSPAERAMLTVRLGTGAQGQRAEFDIVPG